MCTICRVRSRTHISPIRKVMCLVTSIICRVSIPRLGPPVPFPPLPFAMGCQTPAVQWIGNLRLTQSQSVCLSVRLPSCNAASPFSGYLRAAMMLETRLKKSKFASYLANEKEKKSFLCTLIKYKY
jgi:hypothetical protein